MYYTIANTSNATSYTRWFDNMTDARHWVINTLDLSLNWVIDY